MRQKIQNDAKKLKAVRNIGFGCSQMLTVAYTKRKGTLYTHNLFVYFAIAVGNN